jgi:predicted dithiol-disulfide oxidoreductase (DUF899 family)
MLSLTALYVGILSLVMFAPDWHAGCPRCSFIGRAHRFGGMP